MIEGKEKREALELVYQRYPFLFWMRNPFSVLAGVAIISCTIEIREPPISQSDLMKNFVDYLFRCDFLASSHLETHGDPFSFSPLPRR